jgi:hypothetical protein
MGQYVFKQIGIAPRACPLPRGILWARALAWPIQTDNLKPFCGHKLGKGFKISPTVTGCVQTNYGQSQPLTLERKARSTRL